MTSTDKLREDWQKAEAEAIRIQAEKDKAIDEIRAKYGDRQRKAVDEAAAKQKVYLDAEAAAALVGRPDGPAVAAALGLTLPE
jgi:hypothetical protein